MPGLLAVDANRALEAVADDLVAAIRRITLSGKQERRESGIKTGEADQTGHAV
jgi:hypothetical protein